ncbi:GNAT family N-acetyltransferase [uncultured Clostridium sp.]|uniref:GNAT family N-acetyltransferase n=1 Tax=uncultured Clostridium sp. TaxID=59620 RepID=UPI0028EB8C2C|nr:GNAT family N-acetyltransferase [uncultured Clostridium sp.]
MYYRNLMLSDMDKIEEIDGECYIARAWREVNGIKKLVDINWLEKELPNGLTWHKEHFLLSIKSGGRAFGCFDDEKMVGYAVINGDIFGVTAKYILLDQMFISKEYRNMGIGKKLFNECCNAAKDLGAEKIYICAASSEETIAFYFERGCKENLEINDILYEIDRNDYQLEYKL